MALRQARRQRYRFCSPSLRTGFECCRLSPEGRFPLDQQFQQHHPNLCFGNSIGRILISVADGKCRAVDTVGVASMGCCVGIGHGIFYMYKRGWVNIVTYNSSGRLGILSTDRSVPPKGEHTINFRCLHLKHDVLRSIVGQSKSIRRSVNRGTESILRSWRSAPSTCI